MKGFSKSALDYDEEHAILLNFLSSFALEDRLVYMEQLQEVSNRASSTVNVFLEDLEDYLGGQDRLDIYYRVLSNTKRYQRMFYSIADALLPAASVELRDTVQDIILRQRSQYGNLQDLPAELKRSYDLFIHFKGKQPFLHLREMGSKQVGQLVSLRGIVTRISDVKPHMSVASFVCTVCGNEEFKVIGGMTFLPLIECNSDACKASKTKGTLHHQTRGSKFTSFQEIRIQEPSDEVPMGQVPRSLKVYAYGSATKQCNPGQLVALTGVFLTMPYSGARGVTAGLVHDTFLEAFLIEPLKKSYREAGLTPNIMEKIQGEDMYTRLAQSIAPEIHGLEDVKKALLLLLVGGYTKEMNDGMKIRGDINVLLMGDPGVAKSQLLKQITFLAPRGIYTTGKGSSGVGLTAAVLKDTITGEMTLEGGALVLADQGVCCIDEFDKMDERDRTAIHEVMEQQTVSIAKAGITTTLNARASILAAANPLYGRYNKNKTPHENINLPAALLSRFDIVFLLLDSPDQQADIALAEAVTFVHQTLSSKTEGGFEPAFIRAYVAEAKRIDPVIPADLHSFVIAKYVEKRAEQKDINKAGYVYVTPRTLLGIIRLAQALARLRFADRVEREDIEEALRLMEASRDTVNMEATEKRRPDPISALFQMVKEECRKNRSLTCSFATLENRALLKGYSVEQLRECLSTYEKINVLMLASEGTQVTLIQ